MDRPTCSQFRMQLKEIKELKVEFDFELPKIKDTRDTVLALGLEKEIREKLGAIRESLHDFFLEQQMKSAEQIMGQDFLGPEAIEIAFGFKPETKDIPLIPFSKAELERARKLEQFLILRIDKTPDGQPLTMQKMNDMKGGKTKDGKILLQASDETGKLGPKTWYRDEDFYIADTPSLGWALVSKEVIPRSTFKNYLKETEVMAKYVKKVFKGQSMSLEYQEAISEFEKAKEEIKSRRPRDWALVANQLPSLKINKLFRATPSEALYDILLMKEKNNQCILSQTYTRTNSQYMLGDRVTIGSDDDNNGVHMMACGFYDYHSNLGVSFARRG